MVGLIRLAPSQVPTSAPRSRDEAVRVGRNALAGHPFQKGCGGMHTRRLADTGMEVSEVGLGTWQLGGDEWDQVSEQQALDVLGAASEAGVNFIDTGISTDGGK